MANYNALGVPLDAELESGSLLDQLLQEYPNLPIHAFIVLFYSFVFGYFVWVVTALLGIL